MTPDPTAKATLDEIRPALLESATRLASLVEPLTPDGVRQPSYCSEWSVADLLSHLGSGAVIFRRRLSEGPDAEVDMQGIWDAWNAKSPDDQAADALVADQALLKAIAAIDAEAEAASPRHFAMGPFNLDVPTFLSLRLSEHVVHTWDVEVTLDPVATIAPDAAELIIDSLRVIAGLVGKPTGAARSLTVRTTAPSRLATFDLRTDGVSLSVAPDTGGTVADADMTADQLIRLVYGRLDPAQAPAAVAELLEVFPGF
jgi:uncharacterized protein (TIGR03083 family)